MISGLSSSKSAVRWARRLSVACLIAVIVHGHASEPTSSKESASGELCTHTACTVVAGLEFQGRHACASLPVDFKRAAKTMAMTAPRVAASPQAAFNTLHSRPGATKIIYLDFDGHVTQNTPWNGSDPTITTTAYDIDNDPSTFSATEQANITEIWERMAECYSPFNVDVTTETPTVADLINTGGSDSRWGVRVLFGVSSPSPAPGAGGVAFVDVFGRVNWGTAPDDIPCFVLQQGVGTGPKFNADAGVHEVGHTLGLSHDGLTSPATTYYSGHGTGKVAWAPHMGVGYYVPLVQWSKGEYLNANNTQDDLAIITKARNGFGYRPDDFANTQTSAKAIPGTPATSTFNINVNGVIERTTDEDWFKIICGSGSIKLDAVGGPACTMLDINLSLFDSKGTLIVADDPQTDVIASINQAVSAGTYYVKIEGVGLGDPLGTGYTDYGSLGQYTITGSYSTKGIKGAPVLAVNSSVFYGIKQPPVIINPNIKVADPDNKTLVGATVKIANLVSGQDVLSLVTKPATMGNITSSYDNTTGILSLTSPGATATLLQFQNALRAVSYSNTSNTPSTTPRKIEYQVNDGAITSNILTSTATIGHFYVTSTYDPGTKTLTIADGVNDKNSNSVAITLRAGLIAVEGAGATRIGDSASSVQSSTYPFSGDVKIVCNFSGGNDTISLVGIKSSTTTLNLGAGNDTANLTYCNITTKLTVNGGSGADKVKLVATKVASQSISSIP